MAVFENMPVFKELTPRTLLVFMFMSIGALNFGFDNGWWSSILTLPSFAAYYGPPGATSIPSSWQSAGTGTANAGMVIGCLIAGAVGRKIGRRWSIVLLVAIALLGMVIQNAIRSYWAVMAGRMINAVSMGIEANTIPVYMAELAPPGIRGSIVNFYQFWQLCGVLTATGVIAGSRHYGDEWAFRTVMVVQCFIPLILLCIVFFLPESPRWLLLRNRPTEALKSLKFIRHGTASPADIETELSLLSEALSHPKPATTYLDCFRGSNGRRTLIAATAQVLQQLQGNSFVSSYGVQFLQQVGQRDAIKAQLCFVSMGIGGALFAFHLSDRIGRRALMIFCAGICWVAIWIASSLASFWPEDPIDEDAAAGALAAMLLWNFTATLGWGSTIWITTSEIATAPLRERTIAIATSLSFIAVLLVSYINPFVQNQPGNLGSKVGFVYGGFSVIAIVWAWFCMPELKGRSLEELDELFEGGVSARQFAKFQSRGVGRRITEIQDWNADSNVSVIEGREMALEEQVDVITSKDLDSSGKV